MSEKEFDPTKPLSNAKYEAFAHAYLVKYNGTDSATKAGYSAASARTQSTRMLSNDEVKARIQYLQKKQLENLYITEDRVVNEFSKVAFANIQDFLEEGMTFKDFMLLPREVAAAVHSVEIEEFQGGKEGRAKSKKIKFKLHDKLAALESLAKHLGLYEKDNGQRKEDQIKSLEITVKGASKSLNIEE